MVNPHLARASPHPSFQGPLRLAPACRSPGRAHTAWASRTHRRDSDPEKLLQQRRLSCGAFVLATTAVPVQTLWAHTRPEAPRQARGRAGQKQPTRAHSLLRRCSRNRVRKECASWGSPLVLPSSPSPGPARPCDSTVYFVGGHRDVAEGTGKLLSPGTTSEGSPGSHAVWKLVSGEPLMPIRLPVPSWGPVLMQGGAAQGPS